MTDTTGNGRPTPASKLPKILAWALLGLFLAGSVYHQFHLLTYLPWEEEAAIIVAAKLVASGERLYSEVFSPHGPLTLLPGWLLEEVGGFGVAGHRVPIAALQLLALLALALSPLVRDRVVAVLFACVASALMLLYLPAIHGHAYSYQVLAGLLLLIALAQYGLPAIIRPERLGKVRIVLGSLLLASVPFLALVYLPAATLLFLAALRRDHARLALIAAAIGLALNLLLLLVIGSLPGYLAQHLYLNVAVLPAYGEGIGPLQILAAISQGLTGGPEFLLVLVVVGLALVRLASREQGLPWRTLLVMVGLAALLVRGGPEYQRLAYLYACLPLPLLFFRRSAKPDLSWLPLGLLLLLLLTKLLLLLPADRARLAAQQAPAHGEFAALAREITTRQEPIIAYPFHNLAYLEAERLPASGNYFYLPWQAQYDAAPKFGVRIDTCAELEAHRPKIMLIDPDAAPAGHPWSGYAGCVQALLERDYRQVQDRPYYLRNDIELKP